MHLNVLNAKHVLFISRAPVVSANWSSRLLKLWIQLHMNHSQAQVLVCIQASLNNVPFWLHLKLQLLGFRLLDLLLLNFSSKIGVSAIERTKKTATTSPTTPLTNANMNLLWSSSTPTTEFITVLAEPFNAETAKSCPILGNVDQPFSSDTLMDCLIIFSAWLDL